MACAYVEGSSPLGTGRTVARAVRASQTLPFGDLSERILRSGKSKEAALDTPRTEEMYGLLTEEEDA